MSANFGGHGSIDHHSLISVNDFIKMYSVHTPMFDTKRRTAYNEWCDNTIRPKGEPEINSTSKERIEGSLSCHTFRDIGPRFLWCHQTNHHV